MISVKLNWGPIICNDCDSCICSTEIAYREQGTDEWTIPSTDNPTQETDYTLSIEENTYYQVRFTFIGPRCNSAVTYISLFYPLESCCPSGYTMSPDASYCYQIDEVPATEPTGSAEILVPKAYGSYSTCGTYIYEPGFNIDGTGASNQIPTTNVFWRNGGTCADNNTTDGPLNRTGLWTTTVLTNQDVGFGVCVDLPESKTYYIGIGADNIGIIKIDGDIVIQQNAVEIANQYSQGAAGTFKIWHVYPIALSAGPHVIEIIGRNTGGEASIGAEIYNATEAELIAATSYADLGSKLIFSSKDEIGNPAQIGTGDTGYTCPAGYSLASCEDPVICRRILTTALVPC